MTADIRLDLQEGRTAFSPGETLAGRVRWRLTEPAEALEVRLFWHTEGKGTEDLEIVDRVRWDQPTDSDEREFHLTLPREPYSFSGSLISLVWAVEAVALPSEEANLQQITVGPGGREVLLGSAEPATDELTETAP